MSKRLQVLLEESELSAIRKTARKHQMTTAEWVRQVLRAARREESVGDPARKLATIRAAVHHKFPTADMEKMLSEIEQGYTGSDLE